MSCQRMNTKSKTTTLPNYRTNGKEYLVENMETGTKSYRKSLVRLMRSTSEKEQSKNPGLPTASDNPLCG